MDIDLKPSDCNLANIISCQAKANELVVDKARSSSFIESSLSILMQVLSEISVLLDIYALTLEKLQVVAFPVDILRVLLNH